jgi:hypothetical protein
VLAVPRRLLAARRDVVFQQLCADVVSLRCF